MQSKIGKRLLAAVLSGCMLISGIPGTVHAAQTGENQLSAVFSEASAGYESTLTIKGDKSLNGEKDVVISNYMREDYVKDGLVLQLDGIDNAGIGSHVSDSDAWVNLINNEEIAINPVEGSDNSFIDGDTFFLNGSKVYLPEYVASAINGDAYTVEFVVESEGYSGYDRYYSPILTVDEAADNFSIFVRTPGEKMELKQRNDKAAERLKTTFDNALDKTSAVTVQKDVESAWYANGEKKASVPPVWDDTRTVKNVILGGRTGGDSYITTAAYHTIRIYNRALTEAELQHNAAVDQRRYYAAETQVPNIRVNDTPLDESGTTTVKAVFKDGEAIIPVMSHETGTVFMNITVDGVTAGNVALVTKNVIEQAAALIPDAITLENMSVTVKQSAIRAAIKEKVKEALEGSKFTQSDGAVTVSGTKSPYTVTLSLGGDTKTKSVAVTLEYAEPAELEKLTTVMWKILRGEFSFDSAENVTLENLQNQVNEKLAADTDAEGIAAVVSYDEGEQCYDLTLSKGDAVLTKPLYVNSEITNLTFDEEFLQGCTTREARNTEVDVKDGAICVSATVRNTYDNVVLPVFNYGRDYMVSVDVKVTDSTDMARWISLAYGVQSNKELGDNKWTFWQMCVRRNAAESNGVECAYMNSQGNWDVKTTAGYTENLNPDKYYNLKIMIKGDYVYEYINDELVVKYAAQDTMKYGKIALSFDAATAQYTNLSVTGDADKMAAMPTKVVTGYETEIYEPETSLTMAPVVVSEDDEKTVSGLVSGTRRPSTILRTVSADMTVEDNGEKIDLKEYVKRADQKALVGFRIENIDVANTFAAYVKEKKLVDIMVIADDKDVLLAACNRAAGVHGMLDCGACGEEVDMIDLVSMANEANSRILVLPQELATEENIQYVQARAVSVWVRTDEDQMLNVILNGADGLLVEDFEKAYDVIEGFDEETAVLTRNTVITAHRGFHMDAPENTERSAMLAVENGADTIECDVYLSKDGEVVVNHDNTTNRLMNENLTVSNSTVEELQKLIFSKVNTAQEGDKLPTLRELFAAADEADPNDDIIHVIEIKTGDKAVIAPMVELIKETGMEDRVIFISFNRSQLELIRQAMPTVAAGDLNSSCSASDDVPTGLMKLFNNTDKYGYFYNCSSGAQNEAIVKAARFRGIYVHPWTVNDQATFETEYINNYHGITTDRTDFAKDYLNKVTTDQSSYTLKAEDTNGVVVDTTAWTRMGIEIEGANMVMKQISGPAVTWDSQTGTCYAGVSGEAVVVFGATYTLGATQKTYTVYSEPVTLEIEPSEKEQVMIDYLQKAEAAKNAAEAAQTKAEDAKVEAETAQAAAEKAQAEAETAKAAAEAATQKAVQKAAEAEADAENAEKAKVAAEAAKAAAEAAKAEAETAKKAAEAQTKAAETAKAAAETAEKAAETAKMAAEAAAEAAKADAKNASVAQAAAEAATAQAATEAARAETARIAAEAAQKAAEIAQTATEAAKKAAEIAREAAETERLSAEAAKKAAETAQEAAKAERNSAEEAKKAAEAAKAETKATAKAASMITKKIDKVTVKAVSTKKIQATWSAVEGADNYAVVVKRNGKTVKTANTPELTYTYTAGKAGYAYTVEVTPSVTYDEVVYKGIAKSATVINKPARPGIYVKKSGSKLRVISKKQTCTGYQIQISNKKSFKSGVKKYNVKNAALSKSIKLSTLKRGKNYVRIRAYKTYSGKTVYSKWSKVKTVKR